MSDGRESIGRTGWTLADQAIVSLGSFLINIQLARALPTSEYGVFALLFSIVFVFQHSCIAALVYPMSLKVAEAPDGRHPGIMSTTMALVMAAVLSFSALLAGAVALVGRPDIAPAIAIFATLWLMQDALRRCFMAEMRHEDAMLGDAVAAMGQAVVVAFLIRRGVLSLRGALIWMGVACALGALVQLHALKLPRPSFAGWIGLVREFWQSGRWAVVSGLLMHLRLQLIPWALSIVHGTAATAAFQAIINVSNLTNPVVFGLCNTISQAAARARANGGNAAAWRTARTYFLIGAPFVVAYAVAVFFLPGLVLRLFYGAGSPYLAYELPLRLLMMALVVNYAVEAYSAYLYGVDGGRIAFEIAGVGLAAAVVGAMLIGPLAVAGAAAAVLIANLARVVPSLRSMRTVIGAQPPPGDGK